MLIEKSEEYTGVYGRSPDILFCAHEEVPTHRINNVQIEIDKRFMFLILRYERGWRRDRQEAKFTNFN